MDNRNKGLLNSDRCNSQDLVSPGRCSQNLSSGRCQSLVSLRMHAIPWQELKNDQHYLTYKICAATHMVSKVWGSTRVRIRNFHPDLIFLQQEEIKILRHLTHPNIILLMGITHSPPLNNPVLVFEHIQFGTLHSWLHNQKKVGGIIVCLDILLQVTDALVFLHSRGYIHCALSSHAVQLASPFTAKLARFEFTIRQDCTDDSRINYEKENFVNWLSPGVLAGERPTIHSDVYSLCAIIWEIFTGKIPWADLSAEDIVKQVKSGARLTLEKKIIPRYLYHLLDVGLRQDSEVLDLQEVRDMLLITRDKAEEHFTDHVHHDIKTGSNVSNSTRSTPARHIPAKQPSRNSKRKLTRSLGTRSTGVLTTKAVQPSDLSRSLIQLGPYGLGRYVEDYSFVSDPAKREFLLSSPYDDGTGSAFSFGDGVDISSGESSPELRAIASSSDSCDSSHNYRKSSDSGIHIQNHHGSDDSSPQSLSKLRGFLSGSQSIHNIGRMGTRRSRLYESMRSRRSATSPRGIPGSCQPELMRRHGSLPRTRGTTSGRADYETGIKPASHRTANDVRKDSGVSPATSGSAGHSPSPLPPPPAIKQKKSVEHISSVPDVSELYTTALESISPNKPVKLRNSEALKWALGPNQASSRSVPTSSKPPCPPGEAVKASSCPPPSVPNSTTATSQVKDKRNVEETANSGENSKSPQRPSGVQEIVSSLESCKTPYTSAPVDIPGQNQTVYRTITESTNRVNVNGRPKSLYCEHATTAIDTCPADKVADILKRNLIRHDSTRFKQERKELGERLKRRDRLSCNLEDQKSVQLIKQAHALMEQDFNKVCNNKLDTNPPAKQESADNQVLKQTNANGLGKRSPTQPEIQTARIYQPKTSRPRLSRARCTSTPIEARSHDPRHTHTQAQSTTSLQQAFHTALEDAATSDVNNSEEAATFNYNTALGKTALENAATSDNNNTADKTSDKYKSAVQDLGDVDVESANNNKKNADDGKDSVTVVREGVVQFRTDNKGKSDFKVGRYQDQQNVSVFSRESYVTVVESESGPHSIIQGLEVDNCGDEGDLNVQLRKPSNGESDSVYDTAPVFNKRNRFSAYSSGRSSMSGCSVVETEDFYCDDELHPSLENDPNMQLLITAIDDIDEINGDAPYLGQHDRESVLSMEIPSTGPQSLRSEYAIDIEQQEIEAAYKMNQSSYHTPTPSSPQAGAMRDYNQDQQDFKDQASSCYSDSSSTHRNISSPSMSGCSVDDVQDVQHDVHDVHDVWKTPEHSSAGGKLQEAGDKVKQDYSSLETPIHSSTLAY